MRHAIGEARHQGPQFQSRRHERAKCRLPSLATSPQKQTRSFALIHAKATPVILTTQEEGDASLTAPAMDALSLQRPLPDDALRIEERGEKEDGIAA
jgi:putative SOS response-associated peptidase YedK